MGLSLKLESATDEDLEWAAEQCGVPCWKPDAVGLAVFNPERVAVVVYESFSQCDCQLSVASDGNKRWLSRKLLAAVFIVPFTNWGLRRMTSLVPVRNTASLQLARKLGFAVEGVMHDATPDDDLMVLGMTRKSCKFIPQDRRI